MKSRSLLWSGCFVILLALGLPPAAQGQTKADQVQTLAIMKGLEIALKQFFVEYNAWPVAALDAADKNGWHRTQGKIIDTLRSDNPRRITFYEPAMAKEGMRAGLSYGELQIPILSDAWGEPLYFILDTKHEGKIPNPDPRDKRERPFIETSILIFSAGPDHDPNTWDDNVLSWK
jgi:hypothetical protein